LNYERRTPSFLPIAGKSGTRIPSLHSPHPFGEETVRKPRETSLRSNAQLFRPIFGNAQIGISFFSVEGREAFTNRAFQEMLGYSEEELSHLENWDKIVHPDDRASSAKRYAELQQGKRDRDEMGATLFSP
jgi:PAS domain-containing protein